MSHRRAPNATAQDWTRNDARSQPNTFRTRIKKSQGHTRLSRSPAARRQSRLSLRSRTVLSFKPGSNMVSLRVACHRLYRLRVRTYRAIAQRWTRNDARSQPSTLNKRITRSQAHTLLTRLLAARRQSRLSLGIRTALPHTEGRQRTVQFFR